MRNFGLLGVIAIGLFLAALPASVIAEESEETDTEQLTGNPEDGERVARQCRTCHTFEEGESHRIGPNLWGVIGRVAGTAEGYRYSRAMSEAEFTWNEETLDPYLENPRRYLRGGKMAFPGLRDDQDRADVIAYIKEITTP